MKNQDPHGLPFVFLAGGTREFFAGFKVRDDEVHDVSIGAPVGAFVVGVDGPSSADRRCISFVKKGETTHYFVLLGQGLALKLACVDDFPRGAVRVLVSVEMAERLREGKGGMFVLWSNGTDLVVDLESFGVETFMDGNYAAKPFLSPDETNTANMTTPPHGG
jgi:hypothetical protein